MDILQELTQTVLYQSRSLECSVCSPKSHWGSWYRTLEELKSSAQNGCGRCFFLLIGLIKCASGANIPIVSGMDVRMAYGSERGSIGVHLGIGDSEIRIGFYRMIENGPWLDMPFRDRPFGDTMSAESTEQSLRWIRNCIANHRDCGTGDETVLPTRILEIADGMLKLIETEQGQLGRYATLSHCWGDYIPIITTTKTLQAYKAGIPLRMLGQTFKDAVLITQHLHLEYLWIDSLCILQDDRTDWQRESANMARVYQNSYLTIAATRSADGSGGCFSHSKDTIIEGIANGMPYKICATIEQPHVPTLESGEHHQSHHWDSYPLLRRGWVYQERLLSPRVLHYGPFELFWECRTETTCECTGITNSWWKEAWKYGTNLPQLKLSHSQALLTSDFSQIYRRWHTIIEQYSKRQLSKPNDRLPALSGLAKQMMEHRRTDKYVAGIWEQSLHFDLLWAAESGARRSREYRAPSWSWASVDGFIHYDMVKTPASISLRPVCKILSVDTIPMYDDPTGEIAGGQMDVAGVLLEATLEVQLHGDPDWHPFLLSDLKSSKGVNSRIWLYGIRMADHETKTIAVDHDLLSLMSEPRFIYSPERVPVIRCLRVAVRRTKAYYLVLARIHGKDEKYERIGIMDHDQKKSKRFEGNEIQQKVKIL